MCNCPQMKASRDFIYMMKVVSATAQKYGIQAFLDQTPDDVNFLQISQCELDRWVMVTGLAVYTMTGQTNNKFICQDETGAVVVTPKGCEYIQQHLHDVDREGFVSPYMEGRLHEQSSGPKGKLGH